jgi:hypothetical protein
MPEEWIRPGAVILIIACVLAAWGLKAVGF